MPESRKSSRNVQYDPAAQAELEAARQRWRRALRDGTPPPKSAPRSTRPSTVSPRALVWDSPEVRDLIRDGRYRAPGFVVEDDEGYDRELAKRSVGPGWAALVDEAFDFRDARAASVRIVQVKEKFAVLTIYIEGGDDEYDRLSELTHQVMRRSAFICEECGAPGLIRNGAWQKTLCARDAEGRPPLAGIRGLDVDQGGVN